MIMWDNGPMQPELLLDARADLGEGPAWDAATATLYWVDIHVGALHQFDPATGIDRTFPFGQFFGCAVPRRTGGLILALQSGFATLDSLPPAGEGPGITALFHPEPTLTGNRFNDGKCDPAGRLLAGTMDDAEVDASG